MAVNGSTEEWHFLSLAHHDCDLKCYINSQDLDGYFKMLNEPSYENLVKYFWVRHEIYDKHAARLKENEKVLIDPILEGKLESNLV